MTFNPSITEFAYFGASIVSLVFALTITLRYKNININKSFCVAAYVHTLWLASVAILNPVDNHVISSLLPGLSRTEATRWLLATEVAHYSTWIIALTLTAQQFCKSCLPPSLRIIAYSISIIGPILTLINIRVDLFGAHSLKVIAWSGIAYSILCLLILEQLYRNMTHDRLMRLLFATLALLMLYDAFLFSQNLVANALNPGLWQIRASIAIASFIFMALGAATLQRQAHQRAKLAFSQPVMFYTTSLTIAGIILLLLAAGGYYIDLNGSSWATVIYTILVSAGIMTITLAFSSQKLRRQLNVAINKHLFNYKYDYRTEWLKLIRLLSQPAEQNQPATRAVSAAADLFRCDGGALWQKKGNEYSPTGITGAFNEKLIAQESFDSEFSRMLKTGWVFAPDSLEADNINYNELIPEWISTIPNCWLIFPLLVDEEITGFIVLTGPMQKEAPNWEDLDLVKTVGRQIANYLARHDQSELLAQARQFETFNKLSAFVMHDLKNLIAQQSLVVKNAEKHKDNPAFVDDAISTIKNSVDRMNILLRKLQQNEPEETKVIRVKDILIEATKRCQKTSPAPTLGRIDEALCIKADLDSIVMVFTHLIHNAQDATPAHGFIDIYVECTDNTIAIHIEDNGEGMSEEFMKSKLFQPFESTKAGKGMGVGVYQAREYITQVGGEVRAESKVGQGTIFTLEIPLAQA